MFKSWDVCLDFSETSTCNHMKRSRKEVSATSTYKFKGTESSIVYVCRQNLRDRRLYDVGGRVERVKKWDVCPYFSEKWPWHENSHENGQTGSVSYMFKITEIGHRIRARQNLRDIRLYEVGVEWKGSKRDMFVLISQTNQLGNTWKWAESECRILVEKLIIWVHIICAPWILASHNPER